MDKTLKNREMVSALADGDLHGEAFALAVETAVMDEDARATWHAYHLVGDALRASDLTRCSVKDGFMARLQSRLQAESLSVPTPTLMPTTVAERNFPQVHAVVMPQRQEVAANAPLFRWKLVAGLASLAAVVAVSWTVLGSGVATGPTLASSSVSAPALTTVAVQTPGGVQTMATAVPDPSMVMIRDPHLDALLAAHKQFGGTSALQGPAGFLRNATFEQR